MSVPAMSRTQILAMPFCSSELAVSLICRLELASAQRRRGRGDSGECPQFDRLQALGDHLSVELARLVLGVGRRLHAGHPAGEILELLQLQVGGGIGVDADWLF